MSGLNDNLTIVNLAKMDNKVKGDAIEVFVDSFYELYTSISKDKRVLKEFFLASFDYNLAYAAIEDNKVVGFLAIASSKERSLKFNKIKCIELFGRIMGTIIYHQMTSILGKPNLENEKDIGIDYLATDENYRGKGIASKMLEYACAELCYDECFIDVAANNIVAKRLYEYVGFKEYSQEHSLSVRLLGFGHIIRMKKTAKN